MGYRTLTLVAASGALLLGACGAVEDIKHVAKDLSNNKNDPVIGGNPPLSLPPGYALRPPAVRNRGQRDGTARLTRTVLKVQPPEGTAGAATRKIKGRSQGESEVLRKAGVARSDGSVVRKTIDIENKRDKEERKSFVNRVLKYDPNARNSGDDGRGKDAKGRSATVTRPDID